MTTGLSSQTSACPFCGKLLAIHTVEIGGRQVPAGIEPCDCEGAREHRSMQEQAERDREDKHQAEMRERRLKRSGIPERYWGAQTDRHDLVIDALTGGLYIQGPVGVGKTELACAIGRAALEDLNKSVLFVKASDLVDMLSQFDDNLEAIDEIKRPDLLIIDDIGMEDPREWSDRKLRRAIDARWDSAKPVIATSNYSKQELAQIKGQGNSTNAEAIVSRLFGMTKKIELTGKDRRIA